MRHPVRGDELTSIEKFLWRFRMVANEAQVLLRGFNNTADVARDINNDLLFSLSNQGTLIVAKFLEIWDPFGSLSKTDERVLRARSVAQPIVDRLRVWTGLKSFRDSVVAHPYQLKNGELSTPWDLLATNRAPTYHAEVVLLLSLTERAVLVILGAFASEYEAIRPLTRSPLPMPNPLPGIQHGTDIDGEQKRVLAPINAALAAHVIEIPKWIADEFHHARTRPSRE